jgi:hypothetical protein
MGGTSFDVAKESVMASSDRYEISWASLVPWARLAALAAAAGVLTSPVAHAVPAGKITCSIYTYFSNATETNQVGLFSTCPGGEKTGRKTKWFTVEHTTVSRATPANKPTKAGNLPCEFLKKGCPNLPAPR